MDYLETYISAKDGLPLSTRHAYRNALHKFFEFVAAHDWQPSEYPQDIIVVYRQWLAKPYEVKRANGKTEKKVRRARTITLYAGVAQRFLRWMSTAGHMERTTYLDIADYTKDNTATPHGGYVAKPIDPRINELIHYYVDLPLPPRGVGRLTLLRNRALIIVLYDTAMRISEALALTRADVIDGRADQVLLRETKGGQPRTVLLGDQSRQYLQEYIAERHDASSAPLFMSHGRDKGKALSPHRAWEIIKDAAEARHLMDNTSPHSLRHKRAQDLLDARMPLEWISSLLGHVHMTTTKEIYAPWVNVGQLSDMLRKYGKEPLDA